MATRGLTLEERNEVRDAIMDDLRHSHRYYDVDEAARIADVLVSNAVPGYLMTLIAERGEQ